MTWEDVLKNTNTEIAKILSRIFIEEYIQELLAKPNPKKAAIEVLEREIKYTKQLMETSVPYKILMEEYRKKIAKYEDAIEKLKKL